MFFSTMKQLKKMQTVTCLLEERVGEYSSQYFQLQCKFSF